MKGPIKLGVAVLTCQAKSTDRVRLGVELDQDRRISAHHPGVVPRFENDEGRSHEVKGAAVRISPLDTTTSEESDVGMATRLRAGHCFHIARPAEPGRVDHASHSDASGPNDVYFNTADLLVVGVWNGSDQCIHRASDWPATQ
jgi:hypothetical protein